MMNMKCRIMKAIALAAVSMLLLSGCGDSGKGQTETNAPAGTAAATTAAVTETTGSAETQTATEPSRLELTLESIVEEDQMMVVTTSYCVVRYPFAFSDIIQVEAETLAGSEALMFRAKLAADAYPMFCLMFDSAEGIPVGTLTLEDGTVLSVTAQIFEAEESLEPDLLQTFYAAQESINDVISSLMDAQGFVPAQ